MKGFYVSVHRPTRHPERVELDTANLNSSKVVCPHCSKGLILRQLRAGSGETAEFLRCPLCDGVWMSGVPVWLEGGFLQRLLRRRARASSLIDYRLAQDVWRGLSQRNQRIAADRKNEETAALGKLQSVYRNGGLAATVGFLEKHHRALLDRSAHHIEAFLTRVTLALSQRDEHGFDRRHEFPDKANEFLEKLGSHANVRIENEPIESLALIRPLSLERFSRPWLTRELERQFANRPPSIVPSSPYFNGMTGEEFEGWIQSQLISTGAHIETTRRTGDMGVDLLIRCQDRVIAIQAKRYQHTVGPEPVREVHAGRTHYRASEVWVVTNSCFTAQARTEAESLNVGLIDGSNLHRLLDLLRLGGPAPDPRSVPKELPSPWDTTARADRPVDSGGSNMPAETRVGGLWDRRRLVATIITFGLLVCGVTWYSGNRDPYDQLRAMVEQWRQSILKGYPEDHADRFYADHIERFYLKRDLRRVDLARELHSLLRTYPRIQRLDIRNLLIQAVSENRAIVTFDKEWRMSGRTTFEGAVQQQLQLVKVGGEWRINQEFEPRVYWVRRQKASSLPMELGQTQD